MLTYKNAGRLFYKAYYNEVNFLAGKEANEDAFKRANLALQEIRLSEKYVDPLEGLLPNMKSFEAQTRYPGLLLGSGYQHETQQLGELKLGFFFDHTLGLPIIPGSSVKGLIRSAFKYPELIKELLQKPDWKDEVKELEMNMFEGCDKEEYTKEDGTLAIKWTPFRMSKHDKFLEGILLSQEGQEGILAEDYLTPHHPDKGSMGQFKNPVPLGFLKVRAGVNFRFRFQLYDFEKLGITARDKFQLCEQIILTFGIGAKTAVGYGQFINGQKAKPNIEKVVQAETQQSRVKTSPKKPEKPVIPLEERELRSYTQKDLEKAQKRGVYIIALVTDNQNMHLTLEYLFEGEMTEVRVKYPGSANIELGRRVRLKVSNAGNPKKNVSPQFRFDRYDR